MSKNGSGQLDLSNLLKEFNLEDKATPTTISKSKVEEKQLVVIPKLETVDVNDPDTIVSKTISKANLILAHVISQIEGGDFTARDVEVAGQIINAITNSTSLIYNNKYNLQNIQVKLEQLRLKEKEIDKMITPGSSNIGNQQNIIVTDRETVLRMLKGAQETKMLGENDAKQIESIDITENEDE